MTPPLALDVQHVAKAYGALPAVRDLSFQVAQGEVYGLLGPNGAGKSTTLKMVATLLDPDAGAISVLGEPLKGRAAQARQVMGVVPQEIALFDTLTGRENLQYFGSLYGLDSPTLRQRCTGVLALLGLSHDADRRVGTYSGGMKRRLNIGASLLHAPRLVLLDEPTAGVDPQTRNHLYELVERLKGEGIAFVYTTHYMEEAERLCDRIGVVDHGQLLVEGTLPQLLALAPGEDPVEIDLTPPEGVAMTELPLPAFPLFENAERTAGGIKLTLPHGAQALPAILSALIDGGCGIAGVRVSGPTLESLFLHLTGRTLRE
ncbi:MAG: ABC transporter ATP-binding protein [bacterium]